jgi:hypothetical protein
MTSLDDTVNRIKKDLASLGDYYDRETMDILLTRDWFDDDDAIDDVLDCADSDAWEWVYNNRFKYSSRIRRLIEPEDYRFPVEKLKIRVVELTDKMIRDIEQEKMKKFEDAFENEWVEHAKTIQDRPYGDIDNRLDDAWQNLTSAKNALQSYLEKPVARKYVSPGSRANPVNTQTELETNLTKVQNEYEALLKEEEEVDSLYWKNKRNDYRKTWMPIM